jgi:ABC-type lipoprotein release transport system permease subunit
MTVYLPLIASQSFLSLSDEVHQYALLVNKPKRNLEIAGELQETLSNLDVAPWQRIETTFYQTMQADKKGNNFVLILIVFLVFVGVLNTILMSVLERTKEFGVIRAIGCRPSKLILLINLESMFLTFLSISLSLIIVIPMIYWFANTGFLLSEPIDMGGVMFQHMRGEFSLNVFLKPMIIVFIASFLVSLPPGFRAARMTPKNAMDIN